MVCESGGLVWHAEANLQVSEAEEPDEEDVDPAGGLDRSEDGQEHDRNDHAATDVGRAQVFHVSEANGVF